MRTILTVLLAIAATGCVVYDEQLVHDTAEPPTGERPDGENPPEPEPAEPLWMSPAGGVQGDVLIASVLSDGTVDLSQVADLAFYGDGELSVLATAARDADEHLLTLSIAATSVASENHLLVTMNDGTTFFVEDAFAVVGDPAEIPPSEGNGGDCP